MTTALPILAGCFGLVVGSFLNVVIWRLPRGESVVTPRSRCPGCKRAIAWSDNVPVVSWLLLRGRCRGCGTGISFRYPLVELLTGALFVLAALRWPDHLPTVILASLALAALLATSFIDWDHKIIPDRITKPGIVLGIALAPLSVGEGLLHPAEWVEGVTPAMSAWLHAAVGAAVGAGVILLIRFLGTLVFRKEAMGLGDVKLLAFVGCFTGFPAVLYALVLASLSGALIGGLRWIVGKRRPLRFPLTLRWRGGEASFEAAWVRKDGVTVLAPEGAEPDPEVRLALTLPHADVLEDEDVHLSLPGSLDVVPGGRGGARWQVRVTTMTEDESELLAFFAQSRRYVPFGPFLALGGAVALLFADQLQRFIVEDYPNWARGLFS